MSTWRDLDAWLRARGIRIGPPRTGQTTGGRHVPGSLHYDNRGRDYGTTDSDAAAVARELAPYAQGPNAPVAELFFSPLNIFYKNGRPIVPSDELRQGHYSHTHVGLAEGADLAGAAPAAASVTPVGLFGGVAADIGRLVVEGAALAAAGGLIVAGGVRIAKGRAA